MTVRWPSASKINPPAAANKNIAIIDTISCPAAGGCVVGGSYPAGSNVLALVEQEASTDWTPTTLTLPVGADPSDQTSTVTGISCTDIGECVAVGNYESGTIGHDVSKIFVAIETAGMWAAATDVPGTKEPISLTGVSCPSAGHCVAVGTEGPSNTAPQGFYAEQSAGFAVMPVTPPTGPSAGPQSTLKAISCPASGGGCLAVGDYLDDGAGAGEGGTDTWHPLIPTLTGTSPSVSTGALPTGSDAPMGNGDNSGNLLNGISCISLGQCVAVGVYDGHGVVLPFSMTTSGANSTAAVLSVPPPNFDSTQPVIPDAVACTTTTTCVAVGQYSVKVNGSDIPTPLFYVDNGSGWMSGEGPVPSDALTTGGATESAVACETNSICLAVGGYSVPDTTDQPPNPNGFLAAMLTEGTISGGAPPFTNPIVPPTTTPTTPTTPTTTTAQVPCPANVATLVGSNGVTTCLNTAAGDEGDAPFDKALLGGVNGNTVQGLLANGGFSVYIPTTYPGDFGSTAVVPGPNPFAIGCGCADGSPPPADTQAELARAKTKAKTKYFVIWRYTHHFTKAGRFKVKITLTKTGKKLLRYLRKHRVKAKVSMTQTYKAAHHKTINGTVSAKLRL